MRWQIQHTTAYTYAAPVRDSFNEVRLQPCNNDHQTVESFVLQVSPTTKLRQYNDLYSNVVHHFDITEAHTGLLVQSQCQITTHPQQRLALDARPVPLSQINEALRAERCYEFLLESRFVDLSPETWRLAVDAIEGEDDAWQCALRLMRFVHNHLTYESKSTTVHTHMREVLEQRRGVCQDFAHVMLGLCRTLKIPALYVSGYLATENACATHAWIEVLMPGFGWIALDPTHDRLPDESYVKIAVGRDYADVAPVAGTYKGTQQRTMSVNVNISAA
ncbi:MAG TPA: transglutaminase family protein [Candidatus Acidoferrum sp.]|nr:transglutaminase family protein [Candidatus Acidoferrum sp.]